VKAAVVTGYGSPEAIRLVSLPDPLPGAGAQLVRVRAASLNPLDLKLRSGALRPSLLLQHCRRLWSRQRFRSVRSWPRGSLMRRLSALVAAGQVRPVVDTVFDLADVQAAHARLDRGGVVGKVVLAMR